jgi:hypothetical protein
MSDKKLGAMPPHPSKWNLMTIRGDDSDRSRVAAFNFNDLVLESMAPLVEAAYVSPVVTGIIMIDGIRHTFVKDSPAAKLLELHLEASRAASAQGQLPDWRDVLKHMPDMLAGTTYQSKMKELLYGHAQYDAAKHGSLYAYFSDILDRARDARLFGRELAELCLSKGGDTHRVHLQSILEQPAVNYDLGRFLIQLQQEQPRRVIRHCSMHGENTTHDDAGCRRHRRTARSTPYAKERRTGARPSAKAQGTATCPADMSDRPRNCWACGLP